MTRWRELPAYHSSVSIARFGAGSVVLTIVLAAVSLSLLAGCHRGAPKGGASSSVEYACPMHPEVVSDRPGKCPKCGMDLIERAKTKVQYTCPMHPEVISDTPGKCPKCGMDLVEMREADAGKAEVRKQWYCPRHPGKLYGPGERCEICGLELARLAPGESEPPTRPTLSGPRVGPARTR